MKLSSLGLGVCVLVLAAHARGEQVVYTSFGTFTSLPTSSPFYPFQTAYTVDSRLGWRFVPDASGGVTRLDAVIERPISTAVNVTFELYNDGGGTPNLLLGSLTTSITRNNTGNTIPQTSFVGDGSIQLVAGQSYYAVLSRSSATAINWQAAAGTPNGVQVTKGSFNSPDPNVWEVFTTTNPGFSTSAFRVSIPGPGGAAFVGLGAMIVGARRRRG